MLNYETCPSCGKSWRTSKIPKDIADSFAGKPDENGDKWGYCLVGIYSMELDRTTHYQCPFCDWTSDGSLPVILDESLKKYKDG